MLVPFAGIDAVAGLTVECEALTGPGPVAVKVTTELLAPTAVPTAVPPNVAVTVAEPALVGAVSVAL